MNAIPSMEKGIDFLNIFFSKYVITIVLVWCALGKLHEQGFYFRGGFA